MIYQKIKPSPALQDYVRCYFVLESDHYLNVPFEIKSSATFSIAMIFNYGTPHLLSNDQYLAKKLPSSFISGISLSPYTLSYQGRVSMMGVIFRDTAFQDLFSIPPLHSWIDDRYDLYNVIGNEANMVNEQLEKANNCSERITILERWLSSRLEKLQPEKRLMDHAVEIIVDRRGMLKMDVLADKMGLSPRQLRRRFKQRVGVGPKVYARLKRFSYINQCLSKDKELSWKYFLNEGYYDQSHMIKEYQEFSRENPTMLLENMRNLYRKLTLQPVPE